MVTQKVSICWLDDRFPAEAGFFLLLHVEVRGGRIRLATQEPSAHTYLMILTSSVLALVFYL
jgi:hypothetical protein